MPSVRPRRLNKTVSRSHSLLEAQMLTELVASKAGLKMANRSRGNSTKTFSGILGIVAGKNAQRLMERAQTANRLAKSLRGRSRQRAYAVKTEALIGLVKRFPEQIIVHDDVRTPRYVLIKNAKGCFGLHGPAHRFAPQPAIVTEEYGRANREWSPRSRESCDLVHLEGGFSMV